MNNQTVNAPAFPVNLQNSPQPRVGNTGAQISICTLVDNLEFLVSGQTWEQVAGDWLGIPASEFEHQHKGMRGYPCRVRYGGIQILYGSEVVEKPHVKVLISGEGMTQICTDVALLLRRIMSESPNVKYPVTQIHLALDDKTGTLDSARMLSAMHENAVTTMKTSQVINGFRKQEGSWVDGGQTIYYGSFQGDRLLRFYDKRLEQFSKTGTDPGHDWYRCELQARRKYATKIAAVLVEQGLEKIPAIIRGVVDFREPDNENNSRRSVCPWWETVTGGSEPLKTGVPKAVDCLNRAVKWLENVVSRTLAEVAAVLGDDALDRIFRAGNVKMDETRLQKFSMAAGDRPIKPYRLLAEFQPCCAVPF